MQCFYPLTAFQSAAGEVSFREPRDCVRQLELPCGQCIGCRVRRSQEWAVRCMHEAQCHEVSSFITLTYEDDPGTLVYPDFVRFCKRLRKVQPFRFFMCGEYGARFERPHYHACLFGVSFTDLKYLGTAGSGMRLYRSAALERLWPQGFSSVGNVSFESAAYVARYSLKKVTGKAAADHYAVLDMETGEVRWRRAEFAQMSRKPGIGATWFQRFHQQVYPRDYVVNKGKKLRVPRYYDKMFKRDFPYDFEDIVFSRELDARKWASDNTESRLRVKEQVLAATLVHKVRSLENGL